MTEPSHILVVDDDADIRRMLQMLLIGSGYRVSLAATGEEALAYLDLVTPDLILLDLNLPGMNGRQVAERVKADQRKPFIPIVLLTAQGDQASKVSALDAGADEFLVKPVELSELLARIRAMVRLQRSQRSLRAEQRKTELLLHLTRELGTTLDLEQLLVHFLDRLSDAVGAVRASIILVEETTAQLFSSTRNRPVFPIEHILRKGVAGWVAQNRQPLIINETREDERWVAETPIQRAVRSVAAVPVLREERVLGIITLVHHTPGYFTDEHLELLGSVASQTVIALENAELFRLTRSQKELLERRAAELERINQMSRHMAELMRPDQLLRMVANLIHTTFGYPHVRILLVEEDRLAVRAVAAEHTQDLYLGLSVPLHHGFAGWSIANREPLSSGDVHADVRYRPLADGDSEIRSELAVPIRTARLVFGALDLVSTQSDAFGAGDLRLLSTIASQLGVALDNARLFDAEQHRAQQLNQINNLSIAITAQLDPYENMQIAAQAIGAIFNINQCGIVAFTSSVQSEPLIVGSPPQFLALLPQLAATLNQNSSLLVTDVAADTRLAPCAAQLGDVGVASLALVPLASGGRQLGLVALDITGEAERFAQSELTLLETVASLIGHALENARLYREVENERSTLNAVLSSAADPILLIDQHNRLLLANRAAEERLALHGAIGRRLSAILAQEELLRALDGLRDDAQAGHEVTLSTGQTFSVSVAPVRSTESALIGRVAVMQDITAIKELERREQERLRSVFRRYVSPQVAEEVLAGGGDFGEPAERDVVVLCADLRGYTSLAEGMEPRELVEQVLNRYFTAMTEVLYRHGGMIDKFLGDGVLGLFGVPIAHADDLERSIAAAVDLQLAFAELTRRWNAELDREIGMGIGMSFGRAVVGNIGSIQRLDYTVIGDVVNTASRLNGLARAGQIIVSHHLVDSLPRDARLPYRLSPIGTVSLKGKHEPHLIYEVDYRPVPSPKV
jgi:adenylate cyclase